MWGSLCGDLYLGTGHFDLRRMGAGWPFHLGGITPYLDRTGIAEKVNGTRFYAGA